jgi:hypothetical protein
MEQRHPGANLAGVSAGGEVMNRTFAGILVCAACTWLAGCIENPGPDKALGQKNELSTTARYRNWNMLELKFKSEPGKVRLIVTNRGPRFIDSVDFLATLGIEYGLTPVSGPSYVWKYRGQVKSLGFGETRDFGIIDSAFGMDLSGLSASATIIRALVNGTLHGHPLGGEYFGTYAGRDTTRGKYSGGIHGTIDADGRLEFYFDWDRDEWGNRSRGGMMLCYISDEIASDSSYAPTMVFGPFTENYQSGGKFTLKDGKVEASLLFGDVSECSDSVVFNFEPKLL